MRNSCLAGTTRPPTQDIRPGRIRWVLSDRPRDRRHRRVRIASRPHVRGVNAPFATVAEGPEPDDAAGRPTDRWACSCGGSHGRPGLRAADDRRLRASRPDVAGTRFAV